MRITETDTKTFVEAFPPPYPQLKFMLLNLLEDLGEKKGKLFILQKNGSIQGRVMVFIDPDHASYGTKVGSFGWINAKKPEFFSMLLDKAEQYLQSKHVNIIRGPRNDPVLIGGHGVQIFGNNEPELFGVPLNQPHLKKKLEKNSYNPDTQYYCIRWTAPYDPWTEKEDPKIKVVNLNYDDIKERAGEIANLYNDCMAGLPDVTALDKDSLITNLNLFKLIKALDFLFFVICNDKIVGLSVLIPNIYDLWTSNPISNVSWYIADVAMEFRGQFIFSKIKNAARNLLAQKQIPSYEGTYIWDKNKQVVDMCLRTGKLVRKHVVYTKKLNGGD